LFRAVVAYSKENSLKNLGGNIISGLHITDSVQHILENEGEVVIVKSGKSGWLVYRKLY